jgi:hypothetical protein
VSITCDAVHKKHNYNLQQICSAVMLFIALRGTIAPYVMQKMDKKPQRAAKNIGDAK